MDPLGGIVYGEKTALQKLGYSSTNSALVNNLALSLSDCYWIQPRGEELTWKDVNLFTNDFVDSFGEITINQDHILFYPLKKVCLSIGMQEQQFHDFIDYQIMTDYLLTNTDRHMNNIAIMRNPDTLELLGFAPVFDSGNSMFYHTPYEGLKNVRFREIKTHSFIEKESKLLQYVRNRDLVHIDKAQMDFSIYEKDILERHIRIPELERLYQKKLNLLEAFQRGKDIWK